MSRAGAAAPHLVPGFTFAHPLHGECTVTERSRSGMVTYRSFYPARGGPQYWRSPAAELSRQLPQWQEQARARLTTPTPEQERWF